MLHAARLLKIIVALLKLREKLDLRHVVLESISTILLMLLMILLMTLNPGWANLVQIIMHIIVFIIVVHHRVRSILECAVVLWLEHLSIVGCRLLMGLSLIMLLLLSLCEANR